MRASSTFFMTLLLAMSAIVGCGGASFEEVAAPLEGTYLVETWSRNDEGCDAEGASIVDQLEETYLVLARAEAMGQPYLQTVSCSDPADCEAKAEAIPKNGNFVAWYTFTFTEAKGANELLGEEVSTGFSSADRADCTQGKFADHSLQALDDGTIRIEQRTRVADYAKDSRGYCTTEGTKAAAKGKACSRLQVITARRWEM